MDWRLDYGVRGLSSDIAERDGEVHRLRGVPTRIAEAFPELIDTGPAPDLAAVQPALARSTAAGRVGGGGVSSDAVFGTVPPGTNTMTHEHRGAYAGAVAPAVGSFASHEAQDKEERAKDKRAARL